jgi:hypothetical protein
MAEAVFKIATTAVPGYDAHVFLPFLLARAEQAHFMGDRTIACR